MSYKATQAAAALRKILVAAPNREMRVREVVARMKALGLGGYRTLYLVRQAIGATYRRVGGWHEHGYTVYRLPLSVPSQPVVDSQLDRLVVQLRTGKPPGPEPERPMVLALKPEPPAPAPRARPLQDRHCVSYDAVTWALRQEPLLAYATDAEMYEYLRECPEWHGQLPPTSPSFRRTLAEARLLIDGASKRAQRRRRFIHPEGTAT